MDLIAITVCKSDQGFDPTTDKSTRCKWEHGLDLTTDTNTGVNGTNELTPQQTQVQGVNAEIMHLTPQQTQVQGVNGTMDLITYTGCQWDHGFDHKYRV